MTYRVHTPTQIVRPERVYGNRRSRESRQHSRLRLSRAPRGSGYASESSGTFGRVLQVTGSVIAPATLVTSLMFYVGWVRTSALFQRFGVDAALLQFSNQDYLLRSVDSLWLPMGLLILTGLGGNRLYRLILVETERGTRTRGVRSLGWSLIAVGTLLVGLGIVEVASPGLLPVVALVFPLALGAGVVLVYTGSWALRCSVAMSSPSSPRPVHAALTITMVALMVVLSLFWASGEYAKAIGRGLADQIATAPTSRPGVVVYSEKRLYLGGGPSISEEVLPDDASTRYRYRYSRLRLLTATGDRLFLIPTTTSPGERSAILLVLDSSIRIETRPGAPA